jgi:hypothetical protein
MPGSPSAWSTLSPDRRPSTATRMVSYRHLSGLLAFYGEDPLTVLIGPLAADG